MLDVPTVFFYTYFVQTFVRQDSPFAKVYVLSAGPHSSTFAFIDPRELGDSEFKNTREGRDLR